MLMGRLGVISAVLLVCSVASADRILIESYVGQRPAGAERVMPMVRTAFEKRGFLSLSAHKTRFQGQACRVAAVSGKPVDLQKLVDGAENDYVNERFGAAAEKLEKALAEMRRNPLVVALNPKNRALEFQALLLYALASGRQATEALTESNALGPQDAQKAAGLRARAAQAVQRRDIAMATLLRSFPSKVLTTREHGREAELLYKRSRGALDAAGTGRLVITVNDSESVVYINGLTHGAARTVAGDYPAGLYRVLVLGANEEARVCDVEVQPNKETRLDWELDSLLVIDDDCVALAYPSEKDYAREATAVSRVVTMRGNDVLAVTVNVTGSRKRPAVAGTLYNALEGTLVRSSIVELTGKDDARTLEQLVDCLLGASRDCVDYPHPEYTPPAPRKDRPSQVEVALKGAASPVTVAEPPRDATPVATASGSTLSYLPGAGLTVVGLAGMGLGIYTSAQPRTGRLHDVATIGLLAGGGLATLGGMYWMYSTWRTAGRSTPVVLITSDTFVVGWSQGF